jgi:hypothetical protein
MAGAFGVHWIGGDGHAADGDQDVPAVARSPPFRWLEMKAPGLPLGLCSVMLPPMVSGMLPPLPPLPRRFSA